MINLIFFDANSLPFALPLFLYPPVEIIFLQAFLVISTSLPKPVQPSSDVCIRHALLMCTASVRLLLTTFVPYVPPGTRELSLSVAYLLPLF